MAAPVVSVAKLPTPAAPALTSVAGPTQEAFRHAPPDRGRAAVGAALRSCLEALPTVVELRLLCRAHREHAPGCFRWPNAAD